MRRYVHVHMREEYVALNAARVRMTDPAWVRRYHKAGWEGMLRQGVRAFGMRRIRYIGLTRPSCNRSLRRQRRASHAWCIGPMAGHAPGRT